MNYRTTILLTLVILIIFLTTACDSNPDSPSLNIDIQNLNESIDAIADAYNNCDYDQILDLTYSGFYEIINREGWRGFLEDTCRKDTEETITVIPGNHGRIIDDDGILLTVIPIVMKCILTDETIYYQSYFVAVSDDDGNTWGFLDGREIIDQNLIRILFHHEIDDPGIRELEVIDEKGAPEDAPFS